MVSCSSEIKQKVIQELNEKHGKDLLDLHKCTELYENLLAQKAAIEKEVTCSVFDDVHHISCFDKL